MELKDLRPEQRNEEWILSLIAHEEHKGIHTRHQCKCGRGWARRRCADCLRECLNELKEL